MGRMLLAIMAGLAILLALYEPCRIGSLYAVRELLRLAHAAGLMDTRGGLGGQIMGFNFYRNPAWVHHATGMGGVAAAYAPAVAVMLLTTRSIARGYWLRRGRGEVPRLVAAALVFGIVASETESALRYPMYELVVNLGERAGLQTYYITVLVVGENGPFHRDTLGARIGNFAWYHAAGLLATLAGACSGMAVFAAAGGMRKPAAKDACHGCGYALAGLARCPECGSEASTAAR
jgi:hypothetical protein